MFKKYLLFFYTFYNGAPLLRPPELTRAQIFKIRNSPEIFLNLDIIILLYYYIKISELNIISVTRYIVIKVKNFATELNGEMFLAHLEVFHRRFFDSI